MKDKKKDKRLLIPKDEFGEEAAEGLGRLSRDEAAEDLRDLSGRLERRLERSRRRPRRIWLPAAAAVVTVLVASAIYVSMFRDRGDGEPSVAMADKKKADSASVVLAEEGETDTVLIAMAAPTEKGDAKSSAGRESMGRADMASSEAVPSPSPEEEAAAAPLIVATDDEVPEVVVEAQNEEPSAEEVIVVTLPTVQQEEAVAEEVIVEAVPMMQKAALRADDTEKDKAAGKIEAARTAAVSDTVRPDGPAAPVGGWESFNDWTRPNISHAGELTSQVTRLVVVAFKVRSDSTLYDLKVVRSGGDSYSREALRLLREGPKWTPVVRDGKVVEEEVKISIMFK